MPTYDYRCEINNRTVEVQHRMSEEIRSWGELCEKAGIDPGATPSESPVYRVANGGNLISSSALGSGSAPACGMGGGCAGGMCGLN